MKTTEVMVGTVGIGGDNPIRIQSMTNTPTMDTSATTDQILRIARAGADIVRVTVQNLKEAENLGNIKNRLIQQQCLIPVVADVHFNPAIAEVAAGLVDKVRINPGNYGVRQKAGTGVLTEDEFRAEVLLAEERFGRLIEICRKNKTALRIGVNHGSLSSRILNRFGNTTDGMVESAMEFLRICVKEDFHQVVISLKSSNTMIMREANIRMVNYMARENMAYPLHLGVTEAGEGDDGRIRSAVGIGSLLAQGIGSTIRVSLTEDPENEIPVARKLVSYSRELSSEHMVATDSFNETDNPGASNEKPFDVVTTTYTGSLGGIYTDKFGVDDIAITASGQVNRVGNIGGDQVPVVIATENKEHTTPADYDPLPDYICRVSGNTMAAVLPLSTGECLSVKQELDSDNLPAYQVYSPEQYMAESHDIGSVKFLFISAKELDNELIARIREDCELVVLANSVSVNPPAEFGLLIGKLRQAGCNHPVILRKDYKQPDEEELRIRASVDFGTVLLNNEGSGIWIENRYSDNHFISSLAFTILQSCRRRTTKTEFISCPSCGRTMFNIQKATSQIKKRTSHLKGLKIAIMGCIVNGPGEMADADYGYVGSGRDTVTLYKKKSVVKRNIPEDQALDELISLIRANGDWVEPQN
jgi:(E)-4-hydroxy-3-methylbut-2-enyl-diphosphate synthase